MAANPKEKNKDRKELWNEERAESHSQWAKIGLKLIYAPFARKIAKNLPPLSNFPIVDLGTGPGILSIELSKLLPDAKIIGIDPSPHMLKIAQHNADEAHIQNFETRLGRAENIPVESETVDCVINQFSLHEWDDPQEGLKEVFRILKPGGSFMLRDFNKGWLAGWKLKMIKGLITIIGEGHMEMFKFNAEEMANLLREAGFSKVETLGKGFTAFFHAVKE